MNEFANMPEPTIKYTFTVESDEDGVLFSTEKPTLEMLQEEIGRFERHIKDNLRPVEEGIWVK